MVDQQVGRFQGGEMPAPIEVGPVDDVVVLLAVAPDGDVADLLEREGLAAYEPNPKHRRAKLLRPTEKGREALGTISVAQKAWSDAIGAEVGGKNLKHASALIDRIQRAVSAHGLPGE